MFPAVARNDVAFTRRRSPVRIRLGPSFFIILDLIDGTGRRGLASACNPRPAGQNPAGPAPFSSVASMTGWAWLALVSVVSSRSGSASDRQNRDVRLLIVPARPGRARAKENVEMTGSFSHLLSEETGPTWGKGCRIDTSPN